MTTNETTGPAAEKQRALLYLCRACQFVTTPIPSPNTKIQAAAATMLCKLGPNYSRRINAVLRIYWMALMAGHIEGYVGDNTIPRIYLAAHERMRKGE